MYRKNLERLKIRRLCFDQSICCVAIKKSLACCA